MANNLIKIDEVKGFIKENSYWIYQYINDEILKDIGEINSDYFIDTIKSMFTDKKLDQINLARLPYEVFPFFLINGKIDYTSLRVETIDFTLLNKEASVYYNYARFQAHKNNLSIELMQTKIGGMPIVEDIIKFTKNITIVENGLELFIKKSNNSISSPIIFRKITESVNTF